MACYKPEGWGDTYYVRTKDRGLAARTVIYSIGMAAVYLNGLQTDLCNGPVRPGGAQEPTRQDHILEPITD